MATKMTITKHSFTEAIIEILKKHYGEYAIDVFEASSILGYLNSKRSWNEETASFTSNEVTHHKTNRTRRPECWSVEVLPPK